MYAVRARTSLLRFHLFASIKARHRFRWIGSSIEFSSLKKTLESSLAAVRNKSPLSLSFFLFRKTRGTSIRSQRSFFFFFEVKFLKVTLVQVFSLPPPPRSFVFFVLDEATHHLKVDVHSTPIFYSVRLTSEKSQVGIRKEKLIYTNRTYLNCRAHRSSSENQVIDQIKKKIK